MNKSEYKLLFLGDSYTVGESVASNESFPFQLVNILNKAAGTTAFVPQLVARTGWTTGDLLNVVHEFNDFEKYDFVFLLIGVNNQYQRLSTNQYREEFSVLLNKAIVLVNGDVDHVFVLSIPDYGYTPFGKEHKEKISIAIDLFNKINKEISAASSVNYIEITGISRMSLSDPAFIASDGLHPSGKMYRLWADKLINSMIPYLA
jgi:lysophospholipase L1-like esterase